MVVCHCHGVTLEDIRDAIEQGHHDLEALARTLGVATCCGGCRNYSEAVVEYYKAADPAIEAA